MSDKPLDSGHAAEFHERVYALMQIIEAIIDAHPMAEHNAAIRDAVEGLHMAAGTLYSEAGTVLVQMEDAESDRTSIRMETL